ncbi:hypothetical protein DPEC_G00178610 [Dallia pectoralis]|uniref:Uncharacterized protein n=1 Tax=Dallia pectoralis TaxID=75939 RepID=A0ACC2GFM6_DALPE|nr:hypothetical protein DPEC_G00178610 [Dallia pectoralis]
MTKLNQVCRGGDNDDGSEDRENDCRSLPAGGGRLASEGVLTVDARLQQRVDPDLGDDPEDAELVGQGADDGNPLEGLSPAHPSPAPNIAPPGCTPPTPRDTEGPLPASGVDDVLDSVRRGPLDVQGAGNLQHPRLLEGTSHHRPEERDMK